MDLEQQQVLLSSAYCGPVQYFSKLEHYPFCRIEHCENYVKQSYRNRTTIATSNGVLNLSIPVVDGPKAKGPILDIKIAYDQPWQLQHWRGLTAAYQNSPFFEYYADDLALFYHQKKWNYLIDFNRETQETVMELIDLKKSVDYTQEYFFEGQVPKEVIDFRYTIHPKSQRQSLDNSFQTLPYSQVFDDKWGFLPNLSILDLLFNVGPETREYLQRSFQQP